MAVAYHSHTFEIPTASQADVMAGTSTDKAVVPASLGSAASSDAGDFATAGQGALADTALQNDDIGVTVQPYSDDLKAIADGTRPFGDMVASTYDPSSIGGDAFDRGNHTGAQGMSTVSGLQVALDDKVSMAEPSLQTMAGPLSAPNLLNLTAPVQQRILRFDKYRSIHATDQAAFEAIVTDAFSTSAIDTYGAFIDGCGFTVTLKPCEMSVITGRTSNFKTVTFANFTFLADTSGTDWDRKVVNAQGTTVQFSNVMAVTSTTGLEVGMCVLDTTENPIVPSVGIARETYITEIVDATTIKLNTVAYRSRTKFWNFVKFKYFMTFRDFTTSSRIRFVNINFRCAAVASCVQMGRAGNDWVFSNIHALDVKDRLITDFADNANGCQFAYITAWSSDNSATRTNYGITVSSNDAKFTNLRVINFLASQVMHGSGYTVVGCHSWQGGTTQFKRQASFVHTFPRPFVTYAGCYIDNGGIEFSNENAGNPNDAFNLISIVGCEFTFNSVADTSSRYITITLVGYEADTSLKGIDGFKLVGCTFRKFVNQTGVIPTPAEVNVNGAGGLDPDAIKNLVWDACYYNVTNQPQNPCRLAQTQTTAVDTWNFAFANRLPFGLKPKSVISTQTGGLLGMKTAADALVYQAYTTYLGGVDTTIVCRFASAVKGTVAVTVDASANT